MARSGSWLRSFNGTTAYSTYDWVPLYTIANGQTINRTLWSWSAALVASTSDGLPTGSSLTRVGLIVREPGASDIPLPITDAEEDWFAIETCRWTGNITESTNVDWLVQAGFGAPDRESKAQRLCVSDEGEQVYCAWETWVAADAVGPFAFVANCAVDCFVLDPYSEPGVEREVRAQAVSRVPGGQLPGVRQLALPDWELRAPLR